MSFRDHVLHRVGAPALVDPSEGYEVWFQEGYRHRDDGPALIDRLHSIWFWRDEWVVADGEHMDPLRDEPDAELRGLVLDLMVNGAGDSWEEPGAVAELLESTRAARG